jgi:hypothetical protein
VETSGYARGAQGVDRACFEYTPEWVANPVKREMAKLLMTGFIKEVIHPEWVANPVLVKKKNNEWRMCVDYTDLNKHCPKDHFGLPRIDQVVDSMAGCVLLCFFIVTQVNIRSRSRRRTKSRLRSSPCSGIMPTKPCPSG